MASPPRLAAWLLEHMLDPNVRYAALGDFEEQFHYNTQTLGLSRARLCYWIQIPLLLPSFISNLLYWSAVMFRNLLKVTVRTILRKKGYSLINISGLATGMACCILILLYIHYEFSYDRFHENAGDINRVIVSMNQTFQGKTVANGTPAPLARTMIESIPEVASATVVFNNSGWIRYEDRQFYENRFYYADPAFLEIFSFPLLAGDKETALREPYSVLVTNDMATKYFGGENPIGQSITMGDEHDFIVTGVLQNIPDCSHIQFDFLASWSTLPRIRGEERMNSWGGFDYKTYFLAGDSGPPERFQANIQNILAQHIPEDMLPGELQLTPLVQPIAAIHFYTDALFEFEPGSDIRTVYLLAAIGLFIILIACFNYMNLATAQASSRTKEVGLRKVVGASRFDLIKQFFGESILISLIAFFLSLGLVTLFLPIFNTFVDRRLEFAFMADIEIILGLFTTFLVIAFIAGSYPSLFLSSFRPVRILKGTFRTSKGASFFRNTLVVIQFSVSITLIICASVTFLQLRYIKNKDLGYSKEHIVAVSGQNILRNHSIEAIKNDLITSTHVMDVTVSDYLPVDIGSGDFARWEGKTEDEQLLAHELRVDYNFFDFYGIEQSDGRVFSRDIVTDTDQAYILNETAVKAVGWENPIGKSFGSGGEPMGTVVGVIKDFHFAPLHLKIQPLSIRLNQEGMGWLSIKISGDNVPATVNFLEDRLASYSPDYPVSFSFLDDRLESMYSQDEKLSDTFGAFTLIAIFIACLGLYGLASFSTERRTKEIGIRKVLGAPAKHILFLLFKEYLRWVLLANAIAWPIAYIAMKNWLQSLEYSFDLGIWLFFFAGITALLIALLTICYQAGKAVVANPVDTLRYE